MNDRAKLLECLIRIRDEGPINDDEGICENVDILWDDTWGGSFAYHLIPVIAKGWPKHSGIHDYPIPSTNKSIKHAERYFDYGGNKWVGQQSVLRTELINYMIQQLEGEGL
jgi:hypothetical protein